MSTSPDFKIFKHKDTQQVIELEQVNRVNFKFLGTFVTSSELEEIGWKVCTTDPGYRGMPAPEFPRP